MNKRVLDGMGVWQSEKIARVQPEWMRSEYANWIPLALANGSFEADTRRIWSTVYSYNRPDISLDDADEIKREFCRTGLLFLWPDQASGKIWGYFTGIEKPGRLPARSRLDKKHEPIGPIPPVDALRSYIELTRSKALDAAVVSQWLANGCLGFGFGFGFGTGSGTGGAEKARAAKPAAPGDPRFQPFVDFAYRSFEAKHGQKPTWNGKDFNGLKALLKRNPNLTPAELERRWAHYAGSTEPFTAKQGDSLAYFCAKFDSFIDGPIYGPKEKVSATDAIAISLTNSGLDENGRLKARPN
jgi:hypothetical protein